MIYDVLLEGSTDVLTITQGESRLLKVRVYDEKTLAFRYTSGSTTSTIYFKKSDGTWLVKSGTVFDSTTVTVPLTAADTLSLVAGLSPVEAILSDTVTDLAQKNNAIFVRQRYSS